MTAGRAIYFNLRQEVEWNEKIRKFQKGSGK